jgi:hypothetical protein
VRHARILSAASGGDEARSRALDLIYALSWRVTRVYRQRGGLSSYVWLTQNGSGLRTWIETEWMETDPGSSDSEALTILRAEMRAEFADADVVRYAVAFPARATMLLRKSILHLTAEQTRKSVVCLEAHDDGAHLRAQREVLFGLGALSAIEETPGLFGELC